jgi:hypothetical protein
MIESIKVEKSRAIGDKEASVIYIKFSDGTFVATEIDHSLTKKKLAEAVGAFAAFIYGEHKKELENEDI